MKLFAVSDLHLGFEANRQMLAQIPAHPEDWLILAGDTGETTEHLDLALRTLAPRFSRLIWVPGNHDLWTVRSDPEGARGRYKYELMVALCRSYGVITPEDAYPVGTFGGQDVRIAPLFLLYDYSFRPANIAESDAIAWARETGVLCADEMLLHPDPYPSKIAWCHARCDETEARLEAGRTALPTVLVNHFPLLESLARLPRIPRFSLWCGTRRSADWHLRFGTKVVVYGHLHIRSTRRIDGIRCEEVSLGYPREWTGRIDPQNCLREILPGPQRG
jgi:3',5'-cyclic AMP phosphodiesterase CpdA